MLAPPVMIDRLLTGRSLLESHRRVTVAFARSTTPAVQLEVFVDMIGSVLALVDDFGGELVQVSGGDKGNVAMAVFGAPVTHADDALRAVKAMLDLHQAVPTTAVGLASVPVFAALLGSERRLFPTHSGDAVNLAARLMQTAAPGQILCDRATWRPTSSHLRHQGTPTLRQLKGRRDRVEVHSIAGWRRSRPATTSRDEPAIVGRDEELGVVESLLDGATASTSAVLVLEGETGMGKSRLARETVDRAMARGLQVVIVDPDVHPRGDSTGLWRDLVGGVTGANPGAAPGNGSQPSWQWPPTQPSSWLRSDHCSAYRLAAATNQRTFRRTCRQSWPRDCLSGCWRQRRTSIRCSSS